MMKMIMPSAETQVHGEKKLNIKSSRPTSPLSSGGEGDGTYTEFVLFECLTMFSYFFIIFFILYIYLYI